VSTVLSSPVEIQMFAISHRPGEVLYSLFLANRGKAEIRRVQLEGRLPESASLKEVVATPGRTKSEGLKEGAVVWAVDNLPAETVLGPFAYRVATSAITPVIARARARWGPGGSAYGQLVGYEDATGSQAEIRIDAKSTPGVVPIAGVGISYLVWPGAKPAILNLTRTAATPPPGTAPGLGWVSALTVTARGADRSPTVPIVLILPLDRPLPPWTPVALYANDGTGWKREIVVGTVTRDGLHAIVAPSHFSTLAVGVRTELLQGVGRDDRWERLHEAKTESLYGQLIEVVAEATNTDWTRSPVDIDVIRTDITGGCNIACTPDNGYCFQVCCDSTSCMVCSGSPDDLHHEEVPFKAPPGMDYTTAGGVSTTLDKVVTLPTFFEGFGAGDVRTVVFRTPTPPTTGGMGVQVRGPSGDSTRILVGIGVVDGQVIRILGSAGMGRIDPNFQVGLDFHRGRPTRPATSTPPLPDERLRRTPSVTPPPAAPTPTKPPSIGPSPRP